ncbi:hypothetical protein BON22_0919 [Cyberlindnera fabianii]|uniref:Uncharacterized protein n=1 Tax=Cyberlindnera fabianii TaxID=36022 RepID=A0A1V2LDN5_CYBFA|nr:hypothetical protein BON22_0919 [Cyberlindnera fabianii]
MASAAGEIWGRDETRGKEKKIMFAAVLTRHASISISVTLNQSFLPHQAQEMTVEKRAKHDSSIPRRKRRMVSHRPNHGLSPSSTANDFYKVISRFNDFQDLVELAKHLSLYNELRNVLNVASDIHDLPELPRSLGQLRRTPLTKAPGPDTINVVVLTSKSNTKAEVIEKNFVRKDCYTFFLMTDLIACEAEGDVLNLRWMRDDSPIKSLKVDHGVIISLNSYFTLTGATNIGVTFNIPDVKELTLSRIPDPTCLYPTSPADLTVIDTPDTWSCAIHLDTVKTLHVASTLTESTLIGIRNLYMPALEKLTADNLNYFVFSDFPKAKTIHVNITPRTSNQQRLVVPEITGIKAPECYDMAIGYELVSNKYVKSIEGWVIPEITQVKGARRWNLMLTRGAKSDPKAMIDVIEHFGLRYSEPHPTRGQRRPIFDKLNQANDMNVCMRNGLDHLKSLDFLSLQQSLSFPHDGEFYDPNGLIENPAFLPLLECLHLGYEPHEPAGPDTLSARAKSTIHCFGSAPRCRYVLVSNKGPVDYTHISKYFYRITALMVGTCSKYDILDRKRFIFPRLEQVKLCFDNMVLMREFINAAHVKSPIRELTIRQLGDCKNPTEGDVNEIQALLDDLSLLGKTLQKIYFVQKFGMRIQTLQIKNLPNVEDVKIVSSEGLDVSGCPLLENITLGKPHSEKKGDWVTRPLIFGSTVKPIGTGSVYVGEDDLYDWLEETA